MKQVNFREGSIRDEKWERKRQTKTKFDPRKQRTSLENFRHEIDRSDGRNPNRRRRYEGKLSQDHKIIEWALDKHI